MTASKFEVTYTQGESPTVRRRTARDHATAAKVAVGLARLGCGHVAVQRFDPDTGWETAGHVRILDGTPREPRLFVYEDARTGEQQALDAATHRPRPVDAGVCPRGRVSGMLVHGASVRVTRRVTP